MSRTIRFVEILERTAVVKADVRCQFRLACSIFTAVLNYHYTPWLPQELSLKHTFSFGVDVSLSEEFSKHLYFIADIRDGSDWTRTIDSVQPTPVPKLQTFLEEALLPKDILNLFLPGLGTCLMQIGELEIQDCHDIVRVHRTATEHSLLGLGYRRRV